MAKRSVTHFFDDEYLQQAQYVNFSKIASVISGSKVTMQKVLSTMMSENISSWTKVEVVSSLTALKTLYLGGSSNIDGVTTNIGANYVGSNNISLIESKGDFGARLNKQPAASRYIFTKRGQSFDKYFNREDLNVLPKYNFEGQDIEYAYFTYTLPMILVNGTTGLGSGYSSDILPRDPLEIEDYLKKSLQGKKQKPLMIKPYFKGFNGTVEQGETPKQWVIKGLFNRINKSNTEITEVPIGMNYKGYIKILKKLRDEGKIKSYDDLCDPKKDIFRFKIKHDIKFSEKSDEEIEKFFKLRTTQTENLTLNDENNAITVFESVNDIFWHYYNFKLKILQERKDFIIQRTSRQIQLDVSKYLFIKAIVEDELLINKRQKKDIEKDLDKPQFDKIVKKDNTYDYLLGMAISSLTVERMKSLMNDIKLQKGKLDDIKKITIEKMWLEDLK